MCLWHKTDLFYATFSFFYFPEAAALFESTILQGKNKK